MHYKPESALTETERPSQRPEERRWNADSTNWRASPSGHPLHITLPTKVESVTARVQQQQAQAVLLQLQLHTQIQLQLPKRAERVRWPLDILRLRGLQTPRKTRLGITGQNATTKLHAPCPRLTDLPLGMARMFKATLMRANKGPGYPRVIKTSRGARSLRMLHIPATWQVRSLPAQQRRRTTIPQPLALGRE
jgi:hypothetical protein